MSADGQQAAISPIFGDLELKVRRQHGPTSWDTEVVSSPFVRPGKPALLRLTHPVELRPDTRVRVLDASIVVDHESGNQPAIVTLGILSEMFLIPQGA
jgi:hypothetical protein